MKITADDWHYGDERIAEVVAWAKANNLVPENVVAAAGIEIHNGKIHYREFVRSETGSVQIDPGTDDVLSVARISPLLVPYPEARG